MKALSNDFSDDFSTELTSNSIILVTYPLANGPAFQESPQGSSDLSARPVSNSGKNRMEFPRDKIGTVTFNRSHTVLIAILIAFVLVLYVMLLVKKKHVTLSTNELLLQSHCRSSFPALYTGYTHFKFISQPH